MRKETIEQKILDKMQKLISMTTPVIKLNPEYDLLLVAIRGICYDVMFGEKELKDIDFEPMIKTYKLYYSRCSQGGQERKELVAYFDSLNEINRLISAKYRNKIA
jgi:hypothetical protein